MQTVKIFLYLEWTQFTCIQDQNVYRYENFCPEKQWWKWKAGTMAERSFKHAILKGDRYIKWYMYIINN